MDAWHLLKSEGGAIEPITSENPKGQHWVGVADDMERIINVGGTDVTQIVGNVLKMAIGILSGKQEHLIIKCPFLFH
jgi:hypothetical protein